MADRNGDGSDGRDGHDPYVVEGDPPTTVSRRTFVKTGAVVAGIAWIGAFGGSILRSLTTGERSVAGPSSKAFLYHVPQGKTVWYAELDGRPVIADEFPVGESAKVYVRGTKALLLRFEPGQLVDRTGTDLGFVAYNSTCTHLGCQVYFVTGATPAGDFPQGVIYCPCHQGAFDPFRGARVVYGPPPAPLPRISLHVIDGMVEAV